jgi:hypothetical protein
MHSFIGSLHRNKRLAQRVVDECSGGNMVRFPCTDVRAQVISTHPSAMALTICDGPESLATVTEYLNLKILFDVLPTIQN